jgi:hypothetical protein
MRLAFAAQALGMILPAVAYTGNLSTLFIRSLGGSDSQAMVLPAVFGLVNLLQLPAAVLVPPARGKRFLLICWLATAALTAAGLLAASLLPAGDGTAWVVIVLMGAGLLAYGSGQTFWFPLLRDVVPPERLGRFFGRLRTIWSATSFTAFLMCGAALGADASPQRYALLLSGIVLLFVARNPLVARIPINPASHALDDTYHDLFGHVRRFVSRPAVVVFVVYYLLLGIGYGILNQPLALFLKFRGMPDGLNVVLFGFKTLGMVCGLYLAGPVVDRVGTRPVLLGAHLLLLAVCGLVTWGGEMPAGPLTWGFMTGLIFCFGAAYGAAGLACTSHLFHLAPVQGRALFLSLGRLVTLGGPALTPLLVAGILAVVDVGTWRLTVAGVGFNIYQAMFAAVGVGLLGLLGMYPLLRSAGGRRNEAGRSA